MTQANKTKIVDVIEQAEDQLMFNDGSRGEEIVVLTFISDPLLPHDLSSCGTTALILKANELLTVGTSYNFLFFERGKLKPLACFVQGNKKSSKVIKGHDFLLHESLPDDRQVSCCDSARL